MDNEDTFSTFIIVVVGLTLLAAGPIGWAVIAGVVLLTGATS